LSSSSFETWLEALEARHLADLTFSEVSRALRALSSAYVERRTRLTAGAALSGSGKRAAFALFYGPLHYLLVEHIVAALGAANNRTSTIVDLGCGTGAAGAACAGGFAVAPALIGIDRHPWALAEAAWTYTFFGLTARTRQGDLAAVEWPGKPATFIAAFTLNELADAERDAIMQRLLARSRHGDSVLVVEPLAGFVAPWWNRWRDEFERAGGRGGEWRFRIELPAIIAKLDRASGLNHRELTGRSLWRGSR
jgi:Methyltransferase domain